MFKKAVVATVFSLIVTTSSPSSAEDVTLNFVNAEIESVVKAVGVIAGKNFLIDPRVKGTINIVSAKPIPEHMIYGVLLSALRMQGFTAVESDGITKIIPEADAKHTSQGVYSQKITKGSDRIVTQVYPIQYETAAAMVPILRTLITPNNTISAYPSGNSLIITDYASNLKRIGKIIESMDKPKDSDINVFRLQYMSAIDAAGLITKLINESTTPDAAFGGTQTIASARFSIVPDVRTNSLLVRSDIPDRIVKIKALLDKLDLPGNGQSGNIHVVYLRNADATKLAETLRSIISGSTTAAPVPAAGTATTTQSPASSIQADAPTNSLIITAPDNIYNSLRVVIDSLDARRAQVFVEALIAEISSDRMAELGIQWQAPLGGGGVNTAVVAGTNFSTAGSNLIALSAAQALPAGGFNLGMIKRMVIGGKEVVGLTALARALQTDANANILSTPNLLTMDNEEAKIVIGKNVPFITGSYAQSAGAAGSTVNPFQTIERKDVGLTLKVKPQVTEGGTVKMKIYQEASSIQDSSNNAGVITNKRSIESTVLVDDDQIIVLGGLMQDDIQDNTEKVPGLGDLPLLGHLFKYETRKLVKTNLMVFLRPKVLKTAASADSLTQDRYEYIRNERTDLIKESKSILPSGKRMEMPPHVLSGDKPIGYMPSLTMDSVLNQKTE